MPDISIGMDWRNFNGESVDMGWKESNGPSITCGWNIIANINKEMDWRNFNGSKITMNYQNESLILHLGSDKNGSNSLRGRMDEARVDLLPRSIAEMIAWSTTGVGVDTNIVKSSGSNVLLTPIGLQLADGQTEPAAVSGYAVLFVDSADGDLKIKFADGTVKTIVIDS